MTRQDIQFPPWLTLLRSGLTTEHLRTVPPRAEGEPRPAAVLILIGAGDAGPDMVFIERALTLRNHPGQIAYPGGGADEIDGDLAGAALREAVEETGVDPTGISVLGALPLTRITVTGFDVTPVVGWWHTPSPIGVADPGEVASVHQIPVAELADPANRVWVRHPSGRSGPGFEVHDLLIWGLTSYFLDGVLELAGWQKPWDKSKIIDVPSRYLADRQHNRAAQTGETDARR